MYRLFISVISIYLLFPISAFAQNEISQNLFNQLKTSIEKTCSNQDYLNCIESTESACKEFSETELAIISQIIDSQAQAIADGQIKQTLVEIKKARSLVLEQNNIQVDKANSCGKQFLVN